MNMPREALLAKLKDNYDDITEQYIFGFPNKEVRVDLMKVASI